MTLNRFSRACAALALPVVLAAQRGTAPAADSAQVAREAYQHAIEAFRNSDLVRAREFIARSVSAWPTQTGYSWTQAVLAAKAGDSTGMFDALGRFASYGAGRSIRSVADFSKFAGSGRFAALVRQMDANMAPLPRSVVARQIDDSTLYPEAVDYDSRSGRFYVASVRERTVVVIEKDGTTHDLMPRRQSRIGAILGVRVDQRHDLLWFTTGGIPQMAAYAPSDSSIAALIAVSLADGKIVRRFDLAPSGEGHSLGDLAIGPTGDVFASDSKESALYWLRSGADTLVRLADPLFHSLQGIAPLADARTLYVADYSHGLLRIDLTTRRVTRLADVPGTTSLGLDGVVLDDGAIVAVQNGMEPARVVRLTPDAAGARIIKFEVLDRNLAVADEPTGGTLVGHAFVYVADSQWDKYDDDGVRKPGTRLAPVILLSLDLRAKTGNR